MAMLSEQSIVLDGVAKAADLFSQVVSAIVHQVNCLGDLLVLSLIMVELDRAWVHIAILRFPSVQIGLQGLVLHTV